MANLPKGCYYGLHDLLQWSCSTGEMAMKSQRPHLQEYTYQSYRRRRTTDQSYRRRRTTDQSYRRRRTTDQSSSNSKVAQGHDW